MTNTDSDPEANVVAVRSNSLEPSWQERLVNWRYSDSLVKRTTGLVTKLLIELGVSGILSGLAVVLIPSILGVSIGHLLPVKPHMNHPLRVAWLVLTPLAGHRLRCFTTDQGPVPYLNRAT